MVMHITIASTNDAGICRKSSFINMSHATTMTGPLHTSIPPLHSLHSPQKNDCGPTPTTSPHCISSTSWKRGCVRMLTCTVGARGYGWSSCGRSKSKLYAGSTLRTCEVAVTFPTISCPVALITKVATEEKTLYREKNSFLQRER